MKFHFLKQPKVPTRLNLRISRSYYRTEIYKFEPYDSNVGELATYIENVPYSNFQFITSREMVIDPRGFTIKTVRANIMLLLTNATVRNGRICEPCQYVVYSPNNYWLVPTRLIGNG